MKLIYTLTALSAILLMSPANASNDLAKSKNCMVCHTVDTKVLGPAFKDISKKYAGDKAAESQLIVKVMKGSQGTWGTNPMPANSQVSQAEAQTLVKWILALK